MALIPTPAELSAKIAFQRRSGGQNIGGVVKTVWAGIGVERSARVMARLGGEGVLAARTQGSTPCEITIRACSQTRTLTTDHRAVELRPREGASARIWNIQSIAPVGDGGDWLNLLCEEDGGDGD